jgi:Pvc16 N-terminal domain
MSDTRAIAAVTVTLQHRLQQALLGSGAGVSVTRPGANGNAQPPPSVNLFLYQVTPNAAWRNDDLPTRRPGGRLVHRPQAALDLHYLLSFYGDDKVFEPQRLLGRVTSTLHGSPILTRAMVTDALNDPDTNPDLADADLAEAVETVRVTPTILSLEELSRLWSIFFQTPYALSVAYQASVVLVEDDSNELETGPPVTRRNLYVLPFHQPAVARVESQAAPQAPIVWDSVLRVLGRNLRGQVVHVRIGDDLIEPGSVDDEELRVGLTSIPTARRRAGVTGLQVVHDLLMGTPEKAHHGSESNVVAFVLRPSLSSITASDPQATMSFDVAPPIRARQKATLLLNAQAGAEAYSFALDPQPSDLAHVDFPISGVATGDYFVRLRVDGAESPLEVEDDPEDPAFGTLVGPVVHVP